MPDAATEDRAAANDLGEYCRRVEEHLSRVNAGNLVRIFGPAFELVRAWYYAAIPLSVVFRGIEQKAERHRAGQSKRPLRLEFCAPDVETVFADWRRAVGVQRQDVAIVESADTARDDSGAETKRPSLTRQLDRAIDKLAQTTGRLDAGDDVQAETARILDVLSALRDESRRARGDARRLLTERARELDQELGGLARLTGRDVVASIEAEAAAELQPFRARLSSADWQRSVDANVDRLLRDRFGLPTLDLEPAV